MHTHTQTGQNVVGQQEVVCAVFRSLDPPVWHHGDRLAPNQTEHRLQVSDSIPPKTAWPALDGEGLPW